jgi:hypothetical protein
MSAVGSEPLLDEYVGLKSSADLQPHLDVCSSKVSVARSSAVADGRLLFLTEPVASSCHASCLRLLSASAQLILPKKELCDDCLSLIQAQGAPVDPAHNDVF